MMRKIFWITIIVLGMVLIVPAFSQFSADPLHAIYQDIRIWEGAGYIRNLPPFSPYPLAVIKDILETVIRIGPKHDAARAQAYLTQLTHQKIDWGIKLEHQSQSDLDIYHWKLGVGHWLQGFISPYVSYGADLMIYFAPQGDNAEPRPPLGQRSMYDLTYDVTSIGSSLKYYFQLKLSATIGTKDLYLHTGVMRRSFGPFSQDSVVYSSSLRAAPGLVFHWKGKTMGYHAAIFMFEATSLYEKRSSDSQTVDALEYSPGTSTGGTIADPEITDLVRRTSFYPNKFMHLQMLNFYPLSWLEIGIFESIIWGPRFDAKYFLPFKILFHLQSAGQFPDNTLVGLYFHFRAGSEWTFPIMLYVDDVDFRGLYSFSSNPRFKAAFHVGVNWTPNKPWLTKLSLEYILATPYMYSHSSSEGSGAYTSSPNYTNYTHFNSLIGANVPPNSDRLSLRLLFRPVQRLNIGLTGVFSQRANASEGRLRSPSGSNTAGTVWDDGYYTHYDTAEKRGEPSFQNYPVFLGQSVIERKIQLGIDVSGNLPATKWMSIAPTVEYTFEYTFNKDLEAGNNSLKSYININVIFSFFMPRKQ